jgi:hypothetical protein
MPANTAECPPVLDGSPCDDGNPETNNDVCDGSSCAGKIALVSQLSFDIAVEIAEGSDEFIQVEQSIKTALAATLAGAGLQCSADDITIIGLYAGSLVVDYRVEVPAAVVTPEIKTNAVDAIADPTSPMANIVIMDASGVEVPTGAPSVLPFKTYAWKKQDAPCPVTNSCGVESTSVMDTYICLENAGLGLSTVPDAACVVSLGRKPETWTLCSGTPDCPTCNDWTQNGDETGLDCGGSMCPSCVRTGSGTTADTESSTDSHVGNTPSTHNASDVSTPPTIEPLPTASVGGNGLIVVLIGSMGVMPI